MGGVISKCCPICLEEEPDNSIPLIEATKSVYNLESHSLSTEIQDTILETTESADSEISDLIDKAIQKFLSHIQSPFTEDGFTEVLNNDKIKLLAKESETGYSTKVEYIVLCQPMELIDLLRDVEHRKEWDENVDTIRLVKTLDNDTTIVYMKYKRFLIIQSRELLLVNKVVRTEKGIAYVSTSCELPEFPVIKEAVRANIEVSGYLLENVDGGRCKVVGFTIGNAGGNIPKTIMIKAAATTLPKLIASIERALKRRKTR
jgi:hypothetical protein